MSPGIEEDVELKAFRESVRRLLARHATPEMIERWNEAGVVDRNLWREAGAIGMLAPSAPEEYGGVGADFRYECVVLEELGRISLEGFGVAVHSGIVTPYLLHFATEAQKRRWLPLVISGDMVLAVAMTEPDAGSDLRGIRTQAVKRGDTYVLNGQKTFISNGQQADLIVVACKSEAAAGRLSLFVVEAQKAPGLRRGRNLHKLGRAAQDTSEIFFDDVEVPAENLLGGVEGEGLAQLMQMLPQERLIIAVMGQAMMERAYSLALEHVQTRMAFGKRLLDFQNTQFKLADARTQIEVGRAFLNHCISEHMEGRLDAVKAAMAKLWITETEWKVIDDCLQLFGGYGYMDEYPISRLFRDSRIDRIHGGASEIMKIVIARSLAGC